MQVSSRANHFLGGLVMIGSICERLDEQKRTIRFKDAKECVYEKTLVTEADFRELLAHIRHQILLGRCPIVEIWTEVQESQEQADL